jgi:hypothetical protein
MFLTWRTFLLVSLLSLFLLIVAVFLLGQTPENEKQD